MKKFFLFACVAAMFASCAPKNDQIVNDQMVNGFMDLARARFAVREYDQKPVEQAKIDSILEAGRLAPTAKNIQPQHIYVLQSPEAIIKINALTRCAYQAPVVFLVCYDTNLAWTKDGESSGNMDCSIVGTHMMLLARQPQAVFPHAVRLCCRGCATQRKSFQPQTAFRDRDIQISR